MRMLLVILLSLLSASVSQNIDEVPSVELTDLESPLSNETTEQNPGSANEYDQEFATPTIQDTSEVEIIENSGEVFEDERSDGTCGSPIVISNTLVDGKKNTEYEVGTELTYSCEFGYATDGANHISRCVVLREGDKPTWTDPDIMCIPRSCGDPGFVLNAHRIGSRFTFPNQVSFECDDGYELMGSGIRYCQVSGRWSGSLPSCKKIFCEQPFHPENGRVFFTSLEYGSQLKYECETGFILKNYQTRTCSENGTWTGPEPLCLDAQCEMPSAPKHGFVELLGGNPRVGSIAIYKCEDERILVGSTTSKCLEIGEWTFPTPKCVEPCIVPDVQHGKIGRYATKRWNRQKVYTELPVGTSFKDGEELYLKCDNQYEPLGRNKQEEKVICEKGQWLETPTCEPAKCRSQPPDMQNGKAANINREHTGYVVYYCANNFKKTKYGNVTCRFGTWEGIPPTCTDRRCYVDKLQFPGLVKGRKNIYKHREVFRFECEKGYDVTESEKKLVCNEGTWKGNLPPCKAASCVTSPPSIKNGRIKSYSELHSSFVSYECEEDYFLQSSSNVQCLFGEWKGNPPLCKDARCYFQNLKFKNGMTVPFKDPVLNGEVIEVKCAAGYSVTLSVKPPWCSNGLWTEYGTSPCKPNNCPVHQINNGAFTKRLAKVVWRWNGRVTEYEYVMETIGTTKPAEERLYVSCLYPFTFQGRNDNDVQVVCSGGRWTPTPACLPLGYHYEKESLAERVTNHSIAMSSSTSTTTSPNRQPTFLSTINSATDFESTETPTAERKPSEVCNCLYEGSDDLVAYSGNESLKAGSKVRLNASVRFHCFHFGYHRFMGSREIICKNCRPWHSSEYPSCVVPVRGDVIINLDSNQKILPGGILTIDQGADVKFYCISNGIADYPSWTTTVPDQLLSFKSLDQSDGYDTYLNTLSIHNASPRHNGFYRCSVSGNRAREIQICIHAKCKMFDESEEFNIHYDNKQEINSSVLFTCKNSNTKLEGPNLLTCLSNGEWSGHPPRCVSKGCPQLPETGTMLITYSPEDRARGSTATFHCFQPSVRKGNSFIKCLPNGEWSGVVPTCTLPSCQMEKLFEHVPENVVPNMINVTNGTLPYGFELQLTCEGDLRLTEPATAKCGRNGDWEVPKVSCVPGCTSIQVPADSNLIIDPERAFYRFGEFVSLYCNPGHVLSAEVERLMCLRDGWSENTIPTCVDPSSLTEVV
ncbi:sushi, von Willebrand factor type A, EGF and pentraxin domain-containing protein 1 [Parasteatoda tepidariorum]|uniref:sushi, von Willebrand factor type A, EGF and pentraxin domain-containing protein 1 n=1 Tax=Parasteatoda tepidariorum TaxID=114398 RepID=UPI0039BC92F7